MSRLKAGGIPSKMAAMRLKREEISRHLVLCGPTVRRVVHALRATVLTAAPEATEALRFGCLCYFHAGAYLGSIGGNICMIEVKGERVRLSFIQGAGVEDPHRMLQGRLKFKRFVPIDGLQAARDARLGALVQSAADLSRPDEGDAIGWSGVKAGGTQQPPRTSRRG